MRIKQKDLVLIPFPFSDMSSSKVRPGIVISNDKFNSQGDDCLIVPVTTVLKDMDYSFGIFQEDMKEGELKFKSRVRVDKIACIHQSLVKMKIGVLNDNVLNKIKTEFENIL